MSRVAQNISTKVIVTIAAIFIIVFGFAMARTIYQENGHVSTVSNTHNQTTQISYSGQNGVNAYVLLQRHAQVQAKHYSFGDLVTSIDGTSGTGPKYWTFYVNGQEASVGAGAYVTKNGDTIMWRLQ